MMIPIPSRGQRFRLRLGVRASQPFSLVVKGYDADRPNSYYFRRRVPFKARLFKGEDKGYKEFSIPLPVSPDLLMLEVYDKVYRDDEGFKIEKLEAEKMEPSDGDSTLFFKTVANGGISPQRNQQLICRRNQCGSI